MINSRVKKPLTKKWINLMKDIIKIEGVKATNRKFIQGLSWEIDGETWSKGSDFTLKDLGYSNNSPKMTQLQNLYLNKKELKEAKNKLLERINKGSDQTSVAFSTVGNKKRDSSQGHCIRSIAVSHFKSGVKGEGEISVDIFYRVTEVTRKFGADLLFLEERIIPMVLDGIEVPLSRIRFYFSNIYLSFLFFVIVFRFVNPVKFLKFIKENEDKIYNEYHNRVKSILEKDRDYSSSRSRRKMHNLVLDMIDEGIINREELKDYIYKEVKT